MDDLMLELVQNIASLKCLTTSIQYPIYEYVQKAKEEEKKTKVSKVSKETKELIGGIMQSTMRMRDTFEEIDTILHKILG